MRMILHYERGRRGERDVWRGDRGEWRTDRRIERIGELKEQEDLGLAANRHRYHSTRRTARQ